MSDHWPARKGAIGHVQRLLRQVRRAIWAGDRDNLLHVAQSTSHLAAGQACYTPLGLQIRIGAGARSLGSNVCSYAVGCPDSFRIAQSFRAAEVVGLRP